MLSVLRKLLRLPVVVQLQNDSIESRHLPTSAIRESIHWFSGLLVAGAGVRFVSVYVFNIIANGLGVS